MNQSVFNNIVNGNEHTTFTVKNEGAIIEVYHGFNDDGTLSVSLAIDSTSLDIINVDNFIKTLQKAKDFALDIESNADKLVQRYREKQLKLQQKQAQKEQDFIKQLSTKPKLELNHLEVLIECLDNNGVLRFYKRNTLETIYVRYECIDVYSVISPEHLRTYKNKKDVVQILFDMDLVPFKSISE